MGPLRRAARGSWRGGAVTALVLLSHGPLAAQTPVLAYTTPDGSACPSRDAFVDLVRARRGHTPFEEAEVVGDDAPRQPTVVVAIHATEGGFAGEVVRRDPDGTTRGRRALEGSECGPLAEALAVISALGVEAMQLEAPAPAEDDSPRVIVRVVERDPERPPALRPIEPPPPAPVIHARLSASTAVGLGPGPAPHLDVSLGGGLRYDAFGTWITFHYADSLVPSAVDGDARLLVRLFRARLAGCWLPAPLLLCAVGSVGMLEGEPREVSEPETGQALVGTAGAMIGAVVMLDEHLGLDVHAELAALLPEMRFNVGATPIWTTYPFLAQLHVSFVVDL